MEDSLSDISNKEINGDTEISRRDFLKGAAVVGAGVVVAGMSSGCGVDNKQEEELLGDPEGVLVTSMPVGFVVGEESLYTVAENRNTMSILEGGKIDFPGEDFDLKVHYSEDVFPTIGFMYMPQEDGIRRNGQISPSVYSLPEQMAGRKIHLSNTVFGNGGSSAEYEIDPNTDPKTKRHYFMVPIICEGDPNVSLIPKGLDSDGKPIPKQKIDSNGYASFSKETEKGFDIKPTDRGMKYDRGHWEMYLGEVTRNEDGGLTLNLLGIFDNRHMYFHPDVLTEDMKGVTYNNSQVEQGE